MLNFQTLKSRGMNLTLGVQGNFRLLQWYAFRSDYCNMISREMKIKVRFWGILHAWFQLNSHDVPNKSFWILSYSFSVISVRNVHFYNLQSFMLCWMLYYAVGWCLHRLVQHFGLCLFSYCEIMVKKCSSHSQNK